MRALLISATVMFLLLPAPVGADDLDGDLKRVADRIAEVAEMIDDITASRSELAAQIKEAAAELQALQAELERAGAAVERIEAAVAGQQSRLDGVRVALRDAYGHLSETEAAISTERAAAIDTARKAYFTGRSGTGFLAIATDRISSVVVGMEYLARAGSLHSHALATFTILRDREQAERDAIQREEAVFASDLGRLESLRADLDAVHADYLAREAEMEDALAVQAHLLDALDEDIAHFERELEGLQAEQGSIRRRIAREQAATASTRTAGPVAGFVRPVPGAITSGFGPRFHPLLGYSRPHTGVDMRAAYGQPIRAAQSGSVILANVWGGYGRTVVLDHGGGVSTLYAHLSSLAVSYGDRVEAGTVIGWVGSSGLATGPHLHFEVRVQGEPVDPTSYLGR